MQAAYKKLEKGAETRPAHKLREQQGAVFMTGSQSWLSRRVKCHAMIMLTGGESRVTKELAQERRREERGAQERGRGSAGERKGERLHGCRSQQPISQETLSLPRDVGQGYSARRLLRNYKSQKRL